MTRPDKEIVEDFGKKIVECKEKCEGLCRNQKAGYYPRSFFLDEKASKVEVIVVGETPGKSSRLERESYARLAEKSGGPYATYEDVVRVCQAIAADGTYHNRTKHLLNELGLSDRNILWAEIAFCEKSDDPKGHINKGLKHSYDNYLSKILTEFRPKGRHLVCLGRTAYNFIGKSGRENQ